MRYQEVLPHPDLQAYVLNYWCFRVPPDDAADTAPMPHVAPPDGCVSLMAVCTHGGVFRKLMLLGPSTDVVRSVVFPNSIYLGIRFVPGMFNALFGAPGFDLKNEVRPADGLLGDFDQDALHTELHPGFNDFGRLDELLLRYVRGRSVRYSEPVNRAVRAIIGAGGNVAISAVVAEACRSERPLQKAFKRDTFLSMKELAGICRLRTTIIRHHVQQQPLASTIYDAGYYDQAHYNHELARATGQKPADFYGYIGQIEHEGVKPYHE